MNGEGARGADREWESLCHRCGQCCFEKWVDGDGTIYPTKIACRYLDIVTRECKVYHKRFDTGEECLLLTPEVVQTVQWLPEDCGYVQHLRGKRPLPEDNESSRASSRSERRRRCGNRPGRR